MRRILTAAVLVLCVACSVARGGVEGSMSEDGDKRVYVVADIGRACADKRVVEARLLPFGRSTWAKSMTFIPDLVFKIPTMLYCVAETGTRYTFQSPANTLKTLGTAAAIYFTVDEYEDNRKEDRKDDQEDKAERLAASRAAAAKAAAAAGQNITNIYGNGNNVKTPGANVVNVYGNENAVDSSGKNGEGREPAK